MLRVSVIRGVCLSHRFDRLLAARSVSCHTFSTRLIKGRAVNTEVPIGPDCTRCGLCVDICPTGSLQYDVKGLSKLM